MRRKPNRQWTEEELAAISDPLRPEDKRLAREFHRTVGAITVRRALMRHEVLTVDDRRHADIVFWKAEMHGYIKPEGEK